MLTQQQLASKADISVTTISRIEKNKVKASLKTIRALAPALNVTIEEMRDLLWADSEL